MRTRTIIRFLPFITWAMLLHACDGNDGRAAGYGNFEATEIMVSARSNGQIMALGIREGDRITADSVVGLIDTTQLHLQREQLRASLEVIRARSSGVLARNAVHEEQVRNLRREQMRVEALLADSAATQQQLDDITGRIRVIEEQARGVGKENRAVLNEVRGIEAQIARTDEQIAQSRIVNPATGTVLAKYAHRGEVAAFGKPLYKLGLLDEMELRVYVSAPQLPGLRIGQEVTVRFDEGDGTDSLKGNISWIASTAEFTPKTIQTKEERVNLVYAVKVRVPNDGRLKIGMPGEMWLRTTQKKVSEE